MGGVLSEDFQVWFHLWWDENIQVFLILNGNIEGFEDVSDEIGVR